MCKERTIMALVYESELIELISGAETLEHLQLVRHMSILRTIVNCPVIPSFEDMVDWHTYLMENKPYAGKIRHTPAGRMTRYGYETYPLLSESALIRKFDVFSHSDLTLGAIAQFHLDLTESHPFLDGNGRISRLVLNAHLCAAKLGLCCVTRDNKSDYLDVLEDHNIARLTRFIAHNLIS